MNKRTVNGASVTGFFTGQIDLDDLPVPVPVPVPAPVAGETVIASGYWTPIIGGDSESGQQYHYANGHWTKIVSPTGARMFLDVYLQFANTGTIVGQLRLKKLPESTIAAAGFFMGPFAYFSDLQPSAKLAAPPMMFAGGAQTEARIFVLDKNNPDNQNPRPMTQADINPQTQFICSMSYRLDVVPITAALLALGTTTIEVDDFDNNGKHIRRKVHVPQRGQE